MEDTLVMIEPDRRIALGRYNQALHHGIAPDSAVCVKSASKQMHIATGG